MYFVKMIRLSPPWGSSQKIKTNICFENCKLIFVFIISLNFYHSQKKPHANSPDREKMLFFQALALQIRGAPIKKRGFVPIFF